jgi:hypothetical protein
MPPAELAELKK